MPAVITHYLMGRATLKQLDDADLNRWVKRYKNIFNLGAQGPDFLEYTPWDRMLFKLGYYMHTRNIGEFYALCLDKIQNAKSKHEKKMLITYISGFLCHYALDIYAHPFIYYQTGFADRKGTLKGASLRRHRFLETTIDCLLAKEIQKKSAYEINISEKIQVSSEDRLFLGEFYEKAIEEVYAFSRTPGEYAKSMRNMALFYHCSRDKTGGRKNIITTIGNFLGDSGATGALIHYRRIKKSVDYLNLENNTWYYPWDNTIELNFSFMELYEKSIDECVILLRAFLKAVRGKLDPKIALHIIGKKNFTTGLESSVKFRYHNKDYLK
jgi:hypothetical protein